MPDICVQCRNYYYYCQCDGSNMLGFAERIEYIRRYEDAKWKARSQAENRCMLIVAVVVSVILLFLAYLKEDDTLHTRTF